MEPNIESEVLHNNTNELDLSDYKLSDLNNVIKRIKDLDNFKNYVSINFSKNCFHGVLDVGIFNFGPEFKLKEVNLNNNSFTYIYGNTKLNKLYIEYNKLKKIDISSDELSMIHVSSNMLFDVDFGKLTNLKYCYCNRNNLSKIPRLSNSVITLQTHNNLLTNINTLSKSIKFLNVSNNSIKNIDPIFLNRYQKLEFLDISYNYLTSFEPVKNTFLKTIFVSHNELTSFHIPLNVAALDIRFNKLTDIKSSNPKMSILKLDNNLLTTKPDIVAENIFTYKNNKIKDNEVEVDPEAEAEAELENSFPGEGHRLGYVHNTQPDAFNKASAPLSLTHNSICVDPPPYQYHNSNHISTRTSYTPYTPYIPNADPYSTYSYSHTSSNNTKSNFNYKPPFSFGKYSDTNPNYVPLDIKCVITI